MVDQPPKPTPVWTAMIEDSERLGVPMCRVKLDVGQHSFRAGIEMKHDSEFAELVARLIRAITQHATERGWI